MKQGSNLLGTGTDCYQCLLHYVYFDLHMSVSLVPCDRLNVVSAHRQILGMASVVCV